MYLCTQTQTTLIKYNILFFLAKVILEAEEPQEVQFDSRKSSLT